MKMDHTDLVILFEHYKRETNKLRHDLLMYRKHCKDLLHEVGGGEDHPAAFDALRSILLSPGVKLAIKIHISEGRRRFNEAKEKLEQESQS